MKKLNLTVLQRLGLMTIIGKVKGRRKDTARRVGRKLFLKIRIPSDEMAKYERQGMPVGDALKETIEIEFTAEEALKLEEMIDDFGELGPADDDWIDPILDQLNKKEVA